MVGGLVQQEEVRAGEEHFRQLELGLLPAGEHAHGLVHLFRGKAQARQGAFHPAAEGEAPGLLKALLAVALALDEGLQLLPGGGRFQQGREVLQLPLHAQEGGEDGEDLFKGGDPLVAADMLFHIAQHRILAKGDGARVGGILAGKGFIEGGFARAVDAHQAHALGFLELEGDILQHRDLAEGEGEGVDCKDRHEETPAKKLLIVFSMIA